MLSKEEMELINILTEAIFPGAIEAQTYNFVLRDMESNPFLVGVYRNGLQQLERAAQQLFRLSLLHLDKNQLNQLLIQNENTPFFELLRDHTLEGVFSDPIYGGNFEGYGWRLLGYAGPTFYPPETINKTRHPTIYYSLGGIVYEEKT
ncbi:gluconate 2-dehydrogenase subunit 3 family protein [Paenibacillus sp. LHD-117]|uniref:gluconate 2-dehydrogenase subunit 3 family protein n=1 Tax=Paenibacillus sp. LHD-117 TaxID=3071412 RepID=UPI0027E01383|nr:gluconate 2-dehydrogenase subunit 3 family protein [Paenibacillus sp. LHD-117]MDQ6417885.1 gluconate 2-dehydrogenase subunit 3 family protein [Paenibacillus sp. LHD-117]